MRLARSFFVDGLCVSVHFFNNEDDIQALTQAVAQEAGR